jgi:hypothetical protein
MTHTLFPLKSHYGPDFERLWERYGYKLNKADADRAWRQTASKRPPIELLLICVDEYRMRLKKSKTAQKYLAGYLRDSRWEDDLEEATYRLNNPKPLVPVRSAFTSAQYATPDTGPLRPWREVLAARAK